MRPLQNKSSIELSEEESHSVLPWNVVLISTYELGRQPFGLASPAAWLAQAGYPVICADLAVESFPNAAIQKAHLIAFYVPMHRATRLAIRYLPLVKRLNPEAHICFYGLYAPVNHEYLKELGVNTTLGGEFEKGLLQICQHFDDPNTVNPSQSDLSGVSLKRQKFLVPDRQMLPPLSHYAQLTWNDSKPSQLVGTVEASRGCKHRCTHCPVVPVYNGRFFVIQKEVVLADIRQQVDLGATHITFGDPDFFNGVGHAIPILKALHAEFPHLTYDVTIKVEHLLKYQPMLSILKDTGCLIITTAMESFDDHVLNYLGKGHTLSDIIRLVSICRAVGIHLNPTFVAFTPWTTITSYADFLWKVRELELIDQVASIQLAIRLLIPEGSGLLKLSDVHNTRLAFNPEKLCYPWKHVDSRVDQLHVELLEIITRGIVQDASRQEIFDSVWEGVAQKTQNTVASFTTQEVMSRTSIPYLNEPWYC